MSFGSAHDGLQGIKNKSPILPFHSQHNGEEENPEVKDSRGGVWPEVRPEYDKMLALKATKIALLFNFPFLMHQKCQFYCEHFINNDLSHQRQ